MARTVEQILREVIGEQALTIVRLQAKVEQLEEDAQLAKAKRVETPPEWPTQGSGGVGRGTPER